MNNIRAEEVVNSEGQPTAQEDSVNETARLRVENNNPTESFFLRKTAVIKEIKDEYVKELALEKKKNQTPKEKLG